MIRWFRGAWQWCKAARGAARAISGVAVAAVAVAAGCGGVLRRFPDDAQTALAHGEMRRLETDRFIIYYPAARRAEIDRFLVRAEGCAASLVAASLVPPGAWHDKMVIVMPEAAFNNAFVFPGVLGYEPVSVIPVLSTLDLTTEFGLLPDPGAIACHELVHYVQFEQISGFWRHVDDALGYLYTPQAGYDPWFAEGLATHFEVRAAPGLGRPTWPLFTGVFAAGYAEHRMNGGDLSELGRHASAGHHYLVGSMFLRFLAERSGDKPLWLTIGDQASALTGWLFAGTFKSGFGTSFGTLLDEFEAWHARTFPVRERPGWQRTLATLGNGARYARGRDGTEAWVADDVDVPAHLVVRDPSGAVLAELGLTDVVPPRTLVAGNPLTVSGLSITADGREVWLTVIDADATYEVPRLVRWRRGESRLTEVSHALGPGATIDPTGGVYYYCDVDGDRWSLAAWDVRRGTRRTLVAMAPGTYVLGAQVSPDGARLAASVWDGGALVVWVIDAATGARLGELRGPATPIWDPSFTDDGRVMFLGVVEGRFQIIVDGRAASDAPYAMFAARSARGTIRFLNREGWEWTLDEIATPAAPAPADTPPAAPAPADTPPAAPAPADSPPAAPAPVEASAEPGAVPPAVPAADPPGGAAPPPATPAVVSDQPYSPWEHFLFPQLRSPTFVAVSRTPHFGAVLGGGDRLGLQRWSIAGYAQPGGNASDRLHWGGSVAYLNEMLAPWEIVATAGFIDWVDPVETDDPDVTLAEERRTRDASLSVARTWRGSLTAALSGVYTQDIDAPPGMATLDRKLGGPALSLAWQSGETTRYTGLRRALELEASAAFYPHALSSFAGDIYDARGALAVFAPLPLGRRHVLAARLRGRALIARDDTGLLQLGGESGLAELWHGSSVTGAPPSFDTDRFPPNLRFIEVLRGYEDHAIATDRAAIADLWWRYPLIIDRGTAATFGFLPASFLRQIDLELFAAGAIDRAQELHAAAGAAVTAQFTLLRIPLRVSYQLARRLRDDEALTQLVGAGVGL
ncbi:MAG TPA: WD40 repeat domain-containing protein [Kofleriaceae bacterium]|nr:WD40 repeat domain-containing protein [Kofleriaceae bacterium]